jgi:hypothetical protein
MCDDCAQPWCIAEYIDNNESINPSAKQLPMYVCSCTCNRCGLIAKCRLNAFKVQPQHPTVHRPPVVIQALHMLTNYSVAMSASCAQI